MKKYFVFLRVIGRRGRMRLSEKMGRNEESE